MIEDEKEDEPPPLFKSWNVWYGLVLAVLGIVIALLASLG